MEAIARETILCYTIFMKANNKLPKSLYRYFWDIKPEKMDARNRSIYVLSRLFEYGDTEAMRWIFRHYSKREMREALKRRGLWPRARVFWSCYLKHH